MRALEPAVENRPFRLRLGRERAQPVSHLVLHLAQALLELGDELVALPLEAGGDVEQPLLDALGAGVGDLREPLGEDGLRLPGKHVDGAVELAGKAPGGVLACGLHRRVELQDCSLANRAAACLVVRSSASTCRRSMSTKRAWIRRTTSVSSRSTRSASWRSRVFNR